MRDALARDLALMLFSYLGSLIHLSLRPTAPRFNRSPGSPNLSTVMQPTEPVHGARGKSDCIQAGQDRGRDAARILTGPLPPPPDRGALCTATRTKEESYDHQ